VKAGREAGFLDPKKGTFDQYHVQLPGWTRLDYIGVAERLSKLLPGATSLSGRLQLMSVSGFQTPLTGPNTPGCVTVNDLRVGEVERHFDTASLGSIQGSSTHQLSGSFSWGGSFLGAAGASVLGGGVRGGGSMSVSGESTFDLTSQALSRADLLSDAVLAIFDQASPAGVPDTVRLVLPSARAARSALQELFLGGPIPFPVPEVQSSYVGDRLTAILRLHPEPAPVFSAVGVPIGPHSLIAGAVRFPGQDEWIQVFPLGLLAFLAGGS
jgi:hypothetical protein